MKPTPRHQCLIYEGAPSLQLRALAAMTRDKLQENYRCLYLNSPPMVAGMQSYLAAAGVDVSREIGNGSLVLSSGQEHLIDGVFDPARMIRTLEDILRQALDDGCAGVWATGDMTWEMGSEKNLSKLLEYEWLLEQFLEAHAEFAGVCQYRCDTLPREAVRQGLVGHPSIFVNETLSRLNPHYLRPEIFTPAAAKNPQLDAAIRRLCDPGIPA